MQATSFDTPASVTCSNAAPVSLSAAVGNEECSNRAAKVATPVGESREAQCAQCGQRGGHLANCPFK
jgi:hypothetical protein